MTELTLDIITRTMFFADISGEIARVKELVQIVLRAGPARARRTCLGFRAGFRGQGRSPCKSHS